jgi:hypothetical protein
MLDTEHGDIESEALNFMVSDPVPWQCDKFSARLAKDPFRMTNHSEKGKHPSNRIMLR